VVAVVDVTDGHSSHYYYSKPKQQRSVTNSVGIGLGAGEDVGSTVIRLSFSVR
jgi:hypothetical protein